MASSTKTHHKSEKIAQNESEEESFSYAIQISMGSVLPMVMQTAIDLGIFDIIAKAGPNAKLSASEIASELSTDNPDASMMLDRILKLLVSHGIIGSSDDDHQPIQRLYYLNGVSKYFAKNEDGVSLGPFMTSSQDMVYMESWPMLKEAILEGGIPFNKVHGTHAFEYPRRDPRFNEVFNKAMFNHTTIVMKRILECYNGFEDLKQLVDVGGGLGVTLNIIISKYPNIKGINYDLPRVIHNAPSYPGVSHVEGNMFESVPQGDAIFMKWILHDWDDEHCLTLLRNCYKAIPENGKVIVVDAILPIMAEDDHTAFARDTYLMDVFMMAQNPGGKERTQQEFVAMATTAGFTGVTFQCRVCNFWVMELVK
ncbi:cathecol O-methyltransferase 1-like [Mercurialis annua]|uniref:cathecol O-methyltransferase 1-like n=1 Tax=Mercurialis annua TaxID=3986 RepID=UPI00215EA670|nr:cathecol O-methyltransferase 1-like [Mercurialis annua]